MAFLTDAMQATVQYILKAKSNFTLFIYIPFQDICE